MPSFNDRVYTVGDTTVPEWVKKLDNERAHEYGYELVIKGLQLEVDSLTAKLNTTIRLSNELNDRAMKQRDTINDQDQRIEELEQALKYLHDNIVDYYPSTYDFSSMANARAVLKG